VQRLAGQAALVTGAGAGLGRAIALRYGQEGARVLAVSDKAAELETLAAEADAGGWQIAVLQADVGDAALADTAFKLVSERLGRLDVLVNNAGIIAVQPIEDTPPDLWDRILATNLRGPYLYSRAAVPVMRALGGGTIINVVSQSAVRGFVGESAYCASKFGLEGLTRALALELEPANIRVVSVTPGALMHTPMSTTTYDAAARASWREPSEFTEGFVRLATEGEIVSGGRYDAWALSTSGVLANLAERELA
jgi:NAD(P)-dependent dehydrogenase (short-subunit alcohol dehydrogenase family)